VAILNPVDRVRHRHPRPQGALIASDSYAMETKRKYKAVLLDIGGTLWSDVFEDRANVRATRLAAALPSDYRHQASDLFGLLGKARTEAIHDEDLTSTPDIARVIGEALTRLSVPTSDELIDVVRRAMVIPAEPGRLFPGAAALLEAISDLGLRAGAVSNTVWRNATEYWHDFETVGVASHLDAIVTSIDCCVRKPHPKIFHDALKRLDAHPDETILVGNSESFDIAPARALGMFTIRVAIEEPVPASSVADAVVTSLSATREIIEDVVQR
jgi:FMN phosphatase YigB (HAD superfamily)